MKILKMSPYCEPEQVSSSHLINDLDRALINIGFTIENYVPSPSRGVSDEIRKKYKNMKTEKKYGGKYMIHRFSMFPEGKNPIIRSLRYLLANIIQYSKGVHAKDVAIIFAASTPPTQGLLCSLVKKRLKVPFIYSLQDIFPDSLVNTGMTKKGSFLWKIGRKIEDYTYRNADRIVVISEGFKQNIISKGVPKEKIEVVSNWIDLDSVHPVDREDNKLISEFGIDTNKFLVVYAGNFGAAQGADIILKVAEKLEEHPDIYFVIFGGGAYFEDAKREAEKLDNVFIHELMPTDRISEVYSLGDVALITCRPGTGNAGMPSKTWSIMACNTPIIASFDTDSDLAGIIKISGAGECVEPENVNALASEIKKKYLMWKTGNKQGNNLREYVRKNASKEKCVQCYIEIIKNLCNTGICL